MSIKNKRAYKLVPGDLIVWTRSKTIVPTKPKVGRFVCGLMQINSGIRPFYAKVPEQQEWVYVGGLGLLISTDDDKYTYMLLTSPRNGEIYTARFPSLDHYSSITPEKVRSRTSMSFNNEL